jgi:RNA-splicing ligase RtcB
MTSKPLGIMGVSRIVGWSRLQVFEALYFVSDRMVVVRTATGIRGVGEQAMQYWVEIINKARGTHEQPLS